MCNISYIYAYVYMNVLNLRVEIGHWPLIRDGYNQLLNDRYTYIYMTNWVYVSDIENKLNLAVNWYESSE